MKSSPNEPSLWAVVLAGGAGTRFWPISTPGRPKQLLPLAGERALVAETVARVLPRIPPERVRLLTGTALAEPILETVPELGPENLWIEPRARGTAPVLAWAAHRIVEQDPDAVMVSLHADHVIEPPDAFLDLLGEIARLATQRDRLFTIGVEPRRPETGYGYIHVGRRLTERPETYEVADFIEKPDADTAQEYLHRGGYLWNSGIFIWRAAGLLEELRRHTPEIASHLPLLDKGDVDGFFEHVPDLSIDEGLLERSDAVAVARASFRWDDVGTWDAVARTRRADADANVSVGDVHAIESTGCIAWAETGKIVLFGVEDLVVVHDNGITFAAPRDRMDEMKALLQRLPESVRRLEE